MCVEEISKQSVTIGLDSYTPLYTNAICSAESKITNVKSHKPFRLLMPGFGNHPVDLLPQKVISSASIHPVDLLGSHIWHAESLCLIPDERDTKFSKRYVDLRDIDAINKNLSAQQSQHMGKNIKPLTAAVISLDSPSNSETNIFNLSVEHAPKTWSYVVGISRRD